MWVPPETPISTVVDLRSGNWQSRNRRSEGEPVQTPVPGVIHNVHWMTSHPRTPTPFTATGGQTSRNRISEDPCPTASPGPTLSFGGKANLSGYLSIKTGHLQSNRSGPPHSPALSLLVESATAPARRGGARLPPQRRPAALQDRPAPTPTRHNNARLDIALQTLSNSAASPSAAPTAGTCRPDTHPRLPTRSLPATVPHQGRPRNRTTTATLRIIYPATITSAQAAQRYMLYYESSIYSILPVKILFIYQRTAPLGAAASTVVAYIAYTALIYYRAQGQCPVTSRPPQVTLTTVLAILRYNPVVLRQSGPPRGPIPAHNREQVWDN